MFKTSMLRSNLCDYSDAYIVVKGRISLKGTYDANKRNKNLTFKNNSPFRSCIWKINNTFIDNAKDIDIVVPMYNLLDDSDNYYRNEINDSANENNDGNAMVSC